MKNNQISLSSNNQLGLSIIIAAHREGIIAHKTMLSLFRALDYAKAKNKDLNYEVIITIDNGDDETRKYFKRHAKDSNIKVYEINFGELAQSRNFGIKKASGKYIAILDADDLISENWLINGLNYIKKHKEPVILHTNYSINFGTQDIIWEKFNSFNKEEDSLIMVWANRWDSAIITAKETLKKFPYQPNTNGYGSEDWHFNSQTLAANIPHEVVPKTILFVRRKDVSEMTIQASGRRTVRKTDLLDVTFMSNIDTGVFKKYLKNENYHKKNIINNFLSSSKKSIKKIHHTAKKISIYRKASGEIVPPIKRFFNKKEEARFPLWLMQEWKNIHLIEKQIFPEKELVKNITLYNSEMHEIGMVFSKLTQYINKKPDIIFFVPWVSKGGADLVVFNYIKAIQKKHSSWQICIISTENKENQWLSQLPPGVDFVPFGKIAHELSKDLQMHLMARLITQLDAHRLVIAQSILMFDFASNYRDLLTNYIVYAFAFCEDTDNEGRIAGHVHSGVPFAYPILKTVFTDNKSLITKAMTEYGYNSNKFIAHYQPCNESITKPMIHDRKNLKILWASRISKQKRPDILVSIAKKLPNNVTLDVYGLFQDGYDESFLNKASSINYMGEFNGISSIPLSEYDLFLYTSEHDGLPNILLEISAGGLPIVAPNVGGIKEFIKNNKTGLLIDNHEDIESYLLAIQKLVKSNNLREELTLNAQELLRSQHSEKDFLKTIEKDFS